MKYVSRKTYHRFRKMQAGNRKSRAAWKRTAKYRGCFTTRHVRLARKFFPQKKGSVLDFFRNMGYSKEIALQWRDGRAAKATVCKTGSGGFNSHSRLQFAPSLRRQGSPLIFPAASFFCVRAPEYRASGGLCVRQVKSGRPFSRIKGGNDLISGKNVV